MSKTAMTLAFEVAGWQGEATAKDRLRAMMQEAIEKGGAGRPDRAKEYFLAALAKANDATLVWQLFPVPEQTTAIRLLFEEVKNTQPKLKDVVEGEASRSVPEGRLPVAAPSAAEVAGVRAADAVPQGQRIIAPAPAAKLPAISHAARDRVARLSILQTFRQINGRPLAEVTGQEMRGWLKNHRRDGHFIGLLDQSVVIPDDVKVGAIVPPDVADRCFETATAMHNAA